MRPLLVDLTKEDRVLLERYRTLQAKPKFTNVLQIESPEEGPMSYWALVSARNLILVEAGAAFIGGDRSEAVAMIAREDAFYRLMARDEVDLLGKMIAFSMLDGNALFARELAVRTPPEEKALLTRLEELARPLGHAELDMTRVLANVRAEGVRFRHTRRFVHLSDETYRLLSYPNEHWKRPWWDPVAPYLYRAHQTANEYVANFDREMKLATVPATGFFAAVEAMRAQGAAAEAGFVAKLFLNPVGRYHIVLSPRDALNGGYPEVGDAFGHAHAIVGTRNLIRLQIRMRAEGIESPDAVRQALAGPLGKAHPDPFTGGPMQFDEASRTLGFRVPTKYLTSAMRTSQSPRTENGQLRLPLLVSETRP